MFDKLKEGDVVYNKRTNSIGIIRAIFDRNEVRTNQDGNIDADELEFFDANNETHKNAEIAPSTILELGL